MDFIQKLFGGSPFGLLAEHTRKVHECVLLLRPIVDAILDEDRERLEELHHEMSRTEHEADQIKDRIRDAISGVKLLAVGRSELESFLAVQDAIADATEDFSVVAVLRPTRVLPELRDDFLAFVDQVIRVSEMLLGVADDIAVLAESAFAGPETQRVLEAIDRIGEEEWKADKLQRAFARHFYRLEDQLDPTTLVFYDKYCQTLSRVANSAERTAKFLRQMIGRA